jgi:Phage integrase family
LQRWRRPFINAPAHIEAIMSQAEASIASPLRAATYQTLVGLLAASGLRIGEAIKLDRSDIDWDQGVLLIRESKFGKSRTEADGRPAGLANEPLEVAADGLRVRIDPSWRVNTRPLSTTPGLGQTLGVLPSHVGSSTATLSSSSTTSRAMSAFGGEVADLDDLFAHCQVAAFEVDIGPGRPTASPRRSPRNVTTW